MAAELVRDFSRFDCGIEPMEVKRIVSVDVPADILEAPLKECLKEAFQAFCAEGEWALDGLLDGEGEIGWRIRGIEYQPFWGDELPVYLSLRPEELADQFASSLEEIEDHFDGVAHDAACISAAIDKWQAAIDRMRATLAQYTLPSGNGEATHPE